MSLPGDQARASVLVSAPPDEAFRIFTEEIDRWWLRGLRYRVAGKRQGIIHIEPRVGGRLFESFESSAGTRVVETGKVLAWEPPARILLEWRLTNFAPSEKTQVEVEFAETPTGTLVTVTHRGWSAIRADHPARHGLDVQGFLRQNGLFWGYSLLSLRTHVEPATSD